MINKSFLNQIMAHEVFITSISFREDSLEIGFLENREQAPRAAIMKSIIVDIDIDTDIELMYKDMQEMARSIVDMGYVEIRNPPQSYGNSSGDIRDAVRQAVVESNLGDMITDGGN